MRYDPDRAPVAADWLGLDEAERVLAVEAYHETLDVDLPNPSLHAVLHVTVENQIAMELAPVVQTLSRLRDEGLGRHDAIHAIATVLAEHMHDLLTRRRDMGSDPNAAYYEALESLSAKSWMERW